MKFIEYPMPEYIEEDAYDPELTRILRIYRKIYTDHRFDLTQINDQNELLDKFLRQHAFIALDDEQKIQAVANYGEKPNTDYGWIEGIASNVSRLGFGSFMIRNLAKVASADGRRALELNSLPSEVGFYISQGFDYIEADPNPDHPRMRREV